MKERNRSLRRPLWIVAIALLCVSCESRRPDRATYPLDTRSTNPYPVDDGFEQDSGTKEARVIRPDRVHPVPMVWSKITIGDDQPFSFEFRDTPVADALRLIADRAGINFVVPPGTTGFVTASLPSVTLNQALDVVLEPNALRLSKDGTVYTIEPVPAVGMVQRIYQPKTVDVAKIEAQLRTILDQDPMSINAEANVVYVMSTPEKLDRIDDLMEVLDQPPREVLIEARIVEVSLDEGYEFGISANLRDIGLGDATLGVVQDLTPPTTDFVVSAVSSDLDAVLRAIQSYGRLNVIASPRVLALNQQPSLIEIIERIPYIESTNTTNGDENGVSTTSVQQVEFEEIGIKLNVTPVLGEGSEVTLKILQEVAELVEFFSGIPVTDIRKIDTRFVVRDRETIVIGGLLKERRRENEEGIPWLMDIPWLGHLFTRTTTETEKIELLVFITPRIVSQGEVMGVTSEFKREFRHKTKEYQQRYSEFLDDIGS